MFVNVLCLFGTIQQQIFIYRENISKYVLNTGNVQHLQTILYVNKYYIQRHDKTNILNLYK